MRKEELKELLEYHDNLYYNNDNPEITDAEYDALKAEYITLAGEYDYVPGEASSDSIKYEHPIPVTSLDKVQITEVDKLRQELERLWPVVIQPKMDGLTLVSYPDGSHVTRGNGKIGEVITNKVVGNVDGLGEIGILPVRSEVVMLKSSFEAINEERIANGEEPFKNPRNAAAGMLRNKDISKVKGLKAYSYNLINNTEDNNVLVQMAILKDSNWNTVFSFVPKTVDEAITFMENYSKEREGLNFEIDGLVIKHNGVKKFGSTGHHPKNAIAVKFEAEGEWTTLKGVTWQTGKTGIIAPVAEIVPVEILGSTISRATLHNISIINALNIRINERVFVVKANDVIPKIIKSESKLTRDTFPIIPPTECPACKGKVEFKKDILYCVNEDCEAQHLGKSVKLASRDALDIVGLSKETIVKMMDYCESIGANYHFMTPLYFTKELILGLPGFAEKSADNLFNSIQEAKSTELKRFILALNIPLVGRSASEDIANAVLTLDNLLLEIDNDFKVISSIEKIGPKMIESLKLHLKDRVELLTACGVKPLDVVKKETVVKNTDIKTFVITGSFEIGRKIIEQLIKDAGHKVSGSVSSKTSYLLASPGEESTTKYTKANSLNVPIINTLEELKNIL